MQLYYDGILSTEVSGLDGEIVMRRSDENKNAAYSYSGTLEFNGVDAEYVRAKLITDSNAKINTIDVVLKDECCNKDFDFKITSEGIEWCEGHCLIKVTLTENSQETKLYDLAKSYLIADDWNAANGKGIITNAASYWKHPKIAYCLEFRPAALQYIALIFGIIIDLIIVCLWMIIAMVVIILKIINLIIKIINAIAAIIGTGQLDPVGENFDEFSEVKDLFKDLQEHLVGCGRTHPSPLIRTYILNCTWRMQCSFVSSILNDANSYYYNSVYWNAPVKKGLEQTSTSYIRWENLPIKTLQMFLDEIKTVYNAEWKFIGNTLYFERKDFFKQNLPVVFDSVKNSDKVISECYKWSSDKKYAYGKFNYSQDGIDWVGDEAHERFNDMVEWNNPYSSAQKDIDERTMQFGMARFRNDGIENDVIQEFEFWYGSAVKNSRNYMLLNNGTAMLPKILIWDGVSTERATVKHDLLDEGIWGCNWTDRIGYNLPMSFNKNLSYGLYKRFFEIENPRTQSKKYLDCEIETEYDCDIISGLDINGSVITNMGAGEIQEARINFKTKTIVFNIKL